MKQILRYILLIPLLFAAPSMAEQSLEDRIKALEKQVSKSKMTSDKVRFGGFLSTDFAYETQYVGYARMPTDTKMDISRGSIVGLQMDYKFTDSTGVGVQMTARGYQNWEPEFMWAYVKHEFDTGISVRAGRLGMPLFLYADYIEVGYAQPWVRPPTEVYDIIPSRSFSGLDVIYNWDIDWATLRFQPFFGEIDGDVRDNGFGDISVPQFLGMNTSLFYDDLTLRAVYAQSNDINLTAADGTNTFGGIITIDHMNAWFAGVGASFDDGDYMVITEIVRSRSPGSEFPGQDAAYLTLGYHLEDVTPYATIARTRSTDDYIRASNPSSAAFFNIARTSYSLGARWDVLLGLALKADVTYASNFGDTNGGLAGKSTGASTADNVLVYTISVDASF
ncbi:hypothetical protein L4C34_04705 [Vibrio profundum]|uniref:hypothetical protein n=1 Tax=Vibrio profundum TaxID=2910247 RepID=UPI003D109C91